MFFFFFDKDNQQEQEDQAPDPETAPSRKPAKKAPAKEIAPALPEIDNLEIRNRIYTIRGKQVMLDKDIASFFEVTTGNLNKAMKRNMKRFPEDFCFQLTADECSRFQIGILNPKRGGNIKYLPYVYTEQGIAMLTSVLHTERAISASILIMEAFVEMRHFIASNALLFDKISTVELRQLEYQVQADKKFEQIFAYINDHKESNQKLFFDGQIYDAFTLLADLIRKATKEIILIDGYIDLGTLNILAKKLSGVTVTVYTHSNTKLTAKDINSFNAQYPLLTVKYTKLFHDRFLILDKKTVYHIGASLKDAGKTCFGISKFEDGRKELLQKLNSIK